MIVLRVIKIIYSIAVFANDREQYMKYEKKYYILNFTTLGLQLTLIPLQKLRPNWMNYYSIPIFMVLSTVGMHPFHIPYSGLSFLFKYSIVCF